MYSNNKFSRCFYVPNSATDLLHYKSHCFKQWVTVMDLPRTHELFITFSLYTDWQWDGGAGNESMFFANSNCQDTSSLRKITLRSVFAPANYIFNFHFISLPSRSHITMAFSQAILKFNNRKNVISSNAICLKQIIDVYCLHMLNNPHSDLIFIVLNAEVSQSLANEKWTFVCKKKKKLSWKLFDVH